MQVLSPARPDSVQSCNSTSALVNRERDLPLYWSQSPSDPTNEGNRWSNFTQGWRVIILGSWLNVLLVLLPISWVLSITMPKSHGVVFILCILTLIPLIKLHDLSTRELALRIGGSKTGLLNASMSNIVEIVVAISALRKCELRVVQSSLIGAMLSKLLLVLGLCFFAGGMRFSEQGFDATATQIHSSLLSISVGAVLLPAAYHFSLGDDMNSIPEWQQENILHMSHSVSIVLLFIYGSYLVFQLWSHTHLYKDVEKRSRRLSVKVPKDVTPDIFRPRKRGSPVLGQASSRKSIAAKDVEVSPPASCCSSPSSHVSTFPSPYGSTSEVTLATGAAISTVRLVNETSIGRDGSDLSMCSSQSSDSNTMGRGEKIEDNGKRGEGESAATEEQDDAMREKKEPKVSWPLTIILLVLVTVAVAVTADWMVESMDGISKTISKEWVGLILLPAVSSIAECMTAMNVSVKDQLTLSISVAVGSTIQTALFVIPFMVTLAWAMGKPLSLLMDPFESVVLYISVQTMSYVVADGKSNWLEGMILVCLYIIIAVTFWFYPGSKLPTSLAVCTPEI